MNSQHKIFVYFLLFILLEVDLAKADFMEDRVQLGDCFAQYFQLLKSWSIYKQTRESETLNVIPNYKKQCEHEDMTDIGKFEQVTENFADTFVYTDAHSGVCSVNFKEEPLIKMSAVTAVCDCIKENCPDYSPPNMPLKSYLKGLYNRSVAAFPKKNHKEMGNLFSQSCGS